MHVYVIPNENRWEVKREGSEEVISNHESKNEAVEAAKEIAIGNDAELVIMKRDGTVDNIGVYGVDPFPSQDNAPDYNKEDQDSEL